VGVVRRLVAWLLSLVARLIVRSLRVALAGRAPESLPHPCIYAFLHGGQVPLLRFPRPRTAVVASLSPDGRLQAHVLRRFGFDVVDGSSSRGGARVLKVSLARLAAGQDLAVAVDGPRGPRGVVKPGVVYLAERAGVPIVPLGSACARAWVFRRAWDAFALPKPYSDVAVVAGDPIAVPPSVTLEALDVYRVKVETALVKLASEAEAALPRP
jgi:lysophospholipid acyltransferase (LPLAT)-like uncharacterized protein